MQEIDNENDISNLCETSEEENEIDDFKNSEQRVVSLKKLFFLKVKRIMNLIHL